MKVLISKCVHHWQTRHSTGLKVSFRCAVTKPFPISIRGVASRIIHKLTVVVFDLETASSYSNKKQPDQVPLKHLETLCSQGNIILTAI